MTSKSFRAGLSRLQANRPAALDLARVVQIQEEGVVPLQGAKLISIDLIRANPNQARRDFPQESLEGLANSIRLCGLLQPVRVRPDGDHFKLVAGERRWRAARMAGLKEIPAIVAQETDSQAMLDGLIENLQREDLNPVDRAEGLRQLKATLGNIPWQEVAARVGLSERRIFQLLDVARLPDSVKADLRAGRLTEKHTRPLRGLAPEKQEEVRRVIEEQGLAAHQVARVTRAMISNPKLDAASALKAVTSGNGVAELVVQCESVSKKIETSMDALQGLGRVERAQLEKALMRLQGAAEGGLDKIRT